MGFQKATKSQAKGRLALFGISGSGKTWTGLLFARVLAGPAGKIAVIDTENASSAKYAGEKIGGGLDGFHEFDFMPMTSFTPDAYIAAIHEAEAAGYDVIIIDSISHAWMGRDGVLALVDEATKRSKSGNAFTTGWRDVTPKHNALVDALVQCKAHLIVTCRQKADWVLEAGPGGKQMPKKVGMAPVQREGLEYEFDVAADMDGEHTMVVTKSRCPAMVDGVYQKPCRDVAEKFKAWLSGGAAIAAPAPEKPATPPAQAAQPSDAELMQFQIQWKEACIARGGTAELADKLLAAKLAKDKTTIEQTSAQYRADALKAVADGKADKVLKPATPPAQATPEQPATPPAETAAPPADGQIEPKIPFDEFWDEAAAIAAQKNVPLELFGASVMKRVHAIGKKGKESTISPTTLAEWTRAMAEDRWDWNTGKTVALAGA